MVEEKKLLEQERAQVLQERRQPLRSAYLRCLGQEEDWQRRARLLLSEFEAALTERQSIYCSLVLPRRRRLELEKSLLVRASTDPVAADLEMAAGLTDIFKHDTHCGDVWNTNKRQNGRLMWLYLRYWELIVKILDWQGSGVSGAMDRRTLVMMCTAGFTLNRAGNRATLKTVE